MSDPTPRPWYLPVLPFGWLALAKFLWGTALTVAVGLPLVNFHGCSPAPTPAPIADISLPAEVQAQPGRQIVVNASTKGTIVHWWVPDTCDVSYHPDVPKAAISAPVAGRYPIVAWTALDGKPTPAAVATLIVGDVPPPGPGPIPVPPGPGPVSKLRVLVVIDKVNVAKLPRGQQDIIELPKDLRDYLNAHCGVGEDGKTPEYRYFDYQQDVSGSSAAWKAGMARAAGKPLPYAIVANESASWDGPLPATKEEWLTILKKYGGP